MFIRTPELQTTIPGLQHFPQTVRNSRIRIYHTQNHNITKNWHLQNGPSVGHDDLVLLPLSWFSIGQKNRPTPSSQPKSWCSCQPPDTIWFTTIMTQPAANKDPETAASCQIFHDLLRSWPNQQPAKTLMLLSAAKSPMSHDNRKLTNMPTDRAIVQPVNSQTRPINQTNQIDQTNETDQTGQSTNI